MIFTIKHIIVDKSFKNKEDFFDFLDKESLKEKISLKKNVVKEGFIAREKEGTTGFEDGFAIPHARVDGVKEPSIFVLVNKNKFEDWDALDGKGVTYAIALIIPEKSGSLHIDVLSTIATKLIDAKFRDIIKNSSKKEIYMEFNNILLEIKNKSAGSVSLENHFQDSKNYLVGISACPAGIAHTFMVKQKMEDYANDNSINIKWETQGANGHKNVLTKEDIDKATSIIIASDIDLDLSRFKDKKIYQTSTNEAIKNTEKVYSNSIEKSELYSGNNSRIWNWRFLGPNFLRSFKSNFGKPWTYLSVTATLLVMVSLIGFSLYGQSWSSHAEDKNLNLYKLQMISSFALSLSMPIMVMFIVRKLTGRSDAQFIAFMASLLLNLNMTHASYNSIFGSSTFNKVDFVFYDWGIFDSKIALHGTNILGSLIVVFIIFVVYKYITNLKSIVSKSNNVFFKFAKNGMSPWVTTTLPAAIMLFVIVFLLGMPLSYISSKITYGIVEYPQKHWWLRLIIGFAFGALISWDLGNTINKFSLIFLLGFAQYDLRFASFIAIGIPLASVGLGTTYALNKKRFKSEDALIVKKSFQMGLDGMSEGPLPLKLKYKWRVQVANVLSTGIATGLTYVVGIYIINGGHIGVLYLGAQAHLAQVNDIQFLNDLLPRGDGAATFFTSIAYGIIWYYIIMFIGALSYLAIASLSFSFGKNKIFQKGI